MNKLNVNNLDKNDPVQGMFLQLLMLARMTSNEKKIVSDLFQRISSGRVLSGPQTSLLTAIYLKYHDRNEEKQARSVPQVTSAGSSNEKWGRFLSR